MQLIVNEGGGEVDQEHASLLASLNYEAMTYFFNIGEAQGLLSFKEGYPDALEGVSRVFFVRTSSAQNSTEGAGVVAGAGDVTLRSKYSLHIVSLGETAPVLGPNIIDEVCIYNQAASNTQALVVVPEEFETIVRYNPLFPAATNFDNAPDVPDLLDLPSSLTYAYGPNSHIFIEGSTEVEFAL